MNSSILDRPVVASSVLPSRVQEPQQLPVTLIVGMEVSQTFFQQGDVLIELVAEFPKNYGEELRKKGDRRLAVSESTGYSHEADAGTLFEPVRYGQVVEGNLWLDVPQGATIRHHEHLPVGLPPGKYRIFGVMEFDPFEAPGSSFAVRRVVD